MLLLLLCAPPAIARTTTRALIPNYIVDRWTVEDGLPLNHQTSIAQGADGYLWITTYDGLVRFDGQTFDVLNRADVPELISNQLIDVEVDAHGCLWLVSEDGSLQRLREGQFQTWKSGADISRASVFWTEGIFSTTNGLYRIINDVPQPWLPDQIPTGPSNYLPGKNGIIWLLYEDGISSLSPDEVVRRHPQSEKLISSISDDVNKACLDLIQPVLHRVPTRSGWWRLSSGAEADPPARLCDARLSQSRAEVAISDGAVWHRTDTTVWRNGVPVLNVQTTPLSLTVDATGDIWVATNGDGLYRIRPSLVHNVGDGIEDGTPVVMVDRQDQLWTSNVGPGLVRYSPQQRRLEPIQIEDGLASLLERRSGDIMAASHEGIYRVYSNHGERLEIPQVVYPQVRIANLFEDREERLWVARQDSLWVQDADTWTQVDAPDGPIRNVCGLVNQADGTILVTTRSDGLYRLRGTKVEHLDEKSGFITNQLRSLMLEDDHLLWIGTADHGLCRMDLGRTGALTSLPFQCVGSKQGLYDDIIHAVLPDDQGRLWMSGNRGIFWVRRTEIEAFFSGRESFISSLGLSERDGMVNREANGGSQPAADVDPRGNLWFATQGGAVGIDPQRVPMPAAPDVVIRSVRVLDNERLGTPLDLLPNERDLTIQWTAPELRWPEQVRFRYRLVGYETDWHGPTADRQATWTNLPPGDFQLEVIAGLGGAWGDPARLPFSRQPASYETWWFRLTMVGIGLLSVGGIAALRVRALRQRQGELERLVNVRTNELAEKNQSLAAQARVLANQNYHIQAQARRLSEVDELKNRFIASLSHELRTPITLILGPLEDLMQSASALGREGRQRLEVVRANAQRLDVLVGQLFDVARLDAGGLPLRARSQDLSHFIRKVTERFTSQAERKGLTMNLRAPPVLPAWFDPDLLDKVVSNLINNAMKFTPAPGTISIEVSASTGTDTFATVAIHDTGIGVHPDEHSRLFDRFYQVDRGDDRRHDGAGIGLALARELVELHGGQIGLRSAPGQGSTFWFTLPLGAEHLAPHEIDTRQRTLPPGESPRAEPPPPAEDDPRPLLVVVEDHPDMRAYLTEHLGQRFRVVAAADGSTGLGLARTMKPAAIVSDVMMPGMDGLELCRQLRLDPQLAAIPVVLVSAKAGEKDRVEGLTLAADYVTKPFRIRDLIARVEKLIPAEEAPAPAPEAPPDAEADRQLRERFDSILQENLSDSEFSVEVFARKAGFSRRQLLREIQRLTEHSPTDYIRITRLNQARALLKRGSYATIAEVAAAVGMSPSYFSRVYTAWAGHPPSEDQQRPS